MPWLLNILDRLTERRVRAVASQHGRRSFVTRLGTALVGGAILPMLPFDRSGQFMGAQAAEPGKKLDCLIVDPAVANSPFDLFDGEGPSEFFQKFLFLGDDRNIVSVYVDGRQVL